MSCFVKRCRQECEVVFYGKEVCEKHWSLHCDEKNFFCLFSEFKIKKSNDLKTLTSMEVNV